MRLVLITIQLCMRRTWSRNPIPVETLISCWIPDEGDQSRSIEHSICVSFVLREIVALREAISSACRRVCWRVRKERGYNRNHLLTRSLENFGFTWWWEPIRWRPKVTQVSQKLAPTLNFTGLPLFTYCHSTSSLNFTNFTKRYKLDNPYTM